MPGGNVGAPLAGTARKHHGMTKFWKRRSRPARHSAPDPHDDDVERLITAENRIAQYAQRDRASVGRACPMKIDQHPRRTPPSIPRACWRPICSFSSSAASTKASRRDERHRDRCGQPSAPGHPP